MLKKILVISSITLSMLHASEITVKEFKALGEHDQLKALIGLSVDSVENFASTISEINHKLHESNKCTLSLALFFQERLNQLASTTHEEPLAHLLKCYNPDNENFGTYFSKGRLLLLTNDISVFCSHIRGKSTSVATHLLGLHKFASCIVDDACQHDQNDQEQRLAQWLSEKIHALEGIIDTELDNKISLLTQKLGYDYPKMKLKKMQL